MATKYRNKLKGKAWNAQGNTVEMEGGIVECLPHFIFCIDLPKQREKVIAEMQKHHQMMLDAEAAKVKPKGNPPRPPHDDELSIPV